MKVSERDTRSIVERRTPCGNGYYDVGSAPGWQNLREFVKGKRKYWPAPYVSDQALLANAGEVRGVQIRGVFCRLKKKKVVDYGKGYASRQF